VLERRPAGGDMQIDVVAAMHGILSWHSCHGLCTKSTFMDGRSRMVWHGIYCWLLTGWDGGVR
jgi:hypothetical protein